MNNIGNTKGKGRAKHFHPHSLCTIDVQEPNYSSSFLNHIHIPYIHQCTCTLCIWILFQNIHVLYLGDSSSVTFLDFLIGLTASDRHVNAEIVTHIARILLHILELVPGLELTPTCKTRSTKNENSPGCTWSLKYMMDWQVAHVLCLLWLWERHTVQVKHKEQYVHVQHTSIGQAPFPSIKGEGPLYLRGFLSTVLAVANTRQLVMEGAWCTVLSLAVLYVLDEVNDATRFMRTQPTTLVTINTE